ncbi:c-type heme family protein [Ascidiimonas aurantiaca]|uniref:c-type heme family protein n=1 Tax=Ascidiimonas aurantiaca TaxID=1685432 RepID=UPI0030EF577A
MKTHHLYRIALTLLISLLYSCKKEVKSTQNAAYEEDSKIYSEGLKIVSENCITCHSPDATRKNRIAPPLVAVKQHYLDTTKTEEEFISEMSSFLISPDIKKSKMPNAVTRFGVMPNLGYSTDSYKAVATYLYRAEIEKPDWFDTHYQEEKEQLLKNSEQRTDNYLEKGRNMALATKSVLGKTLLGAIQSKGTEGAVTFCNERALRITDSMAVHLKASIKRVSDKNRNPNNAANARELAYIEQAKTALKEKGSAASKIFEKNNKITGYYPIVTNNMCLQCHGTPAKDINSKALSKIKILYPNDKATGYAVNELRGIWVVEMQK